jgi:archaellin
MGKLITTGLTSSILLISLFLIGITVAQVISSETTGNISEQQIEQMTEETIEELSTYILIKDQIGKYKEINRELIIEKIALWITPLVTQDIDVSQLTIQLKTGDNVLFLKYSNKSVNLGPYSLFENTIWKILNGSNFGFISIIDLDKSLVDYDTFNDCSDNAYIVFRLPESIRLYKHEKLIVTLFPSTGITRTIELKAPLPIKSVVKFD